MWTLLRSLGLRRALREQLPALAGSVVIAECFYKFHSFTLECLAFLGTWCFLDALSAALLRSLRPPVRASADSRLHGG